MPYLLASQLLDEFKKYGVEGSTVRIVDHAVKPDPTPLHNRSPVALNLDFY